MRSRRPAGLPDPGTRYAKPFIERERGECAYMLGLTYQSDVCAAPVRDEGEPYCPWHMAVCYVPTNRMSTSSPVREATIAKRVKEPEEDGGGLFDPIAEDALEEEAD